MRPPLYCTNARLFRRPWQATPTSSTWSGSGRAAPSRQHLLQGVVVPGGGGPNLLLAQPQVCSLLHYTPSCPADSNCPDGLATCPKSSDASSSTATAKLGFAPDPTASERQQMTYTYMPFLSLHRLLSPVDTNPVSHHLARYGPRALEPGRRARRISHGAEAERRKVTHRGRFCTAPHCRSAFR